MILTKYRMMNINDDGYVETLSLEEAQAYSGIYITVQEDINDNITEEITL
jgi:hypothetical protein